MTIDDFLSQITKEKTMCIHCKYAFPDECSDKCRIEEAVKVCRDHRQLMVEGMKSDAFKKVKVNQTKDSCAVFIVNPNKMVDVKPFENEHTKFTLGELFEYVMNTTYYGEVFCVVSRPNATEMYKFIRFANKVVSIGEGIGYNDATLH